MKEPAYACSLCVCAYIPEPRVFHILCIISWSFSIIILMNQIKICFKDTDSCMEPQTVPLTFGFLVIQNNTIYNCQENTFNIPKIWYLLLFRYVLQCYIIHDIFMATID